jgi:DNA-binding MarR family transcriptional regulator
VLDRILVSIETNFKMNDEPLDLPAFLPYQLSVASNRVSAALAKLYADEFGLSIAEWRVMAIAGRFPGLSGNEVAARSAMDKVQVSRAVAGMIRKGLIVRKSDTLDRRKSALSLSGDGEAIYRQIVPQAREYERRMLARLSSEEHAILSAALNRLAGTTD